MGGWVQSGGGFLSTPATRAAGGGYTVGQVYSSLTGGSSSDLSAAQIMRRADLAKKAAADAAAKAAAEKARIAAVCLKQKPSMIPHFFADHGITPTPEHDWTCKNGEWIWSMTAAEKAQFLEVEKRLDEAPYTPTPTEKIPAQIQCQRGEWYNINALQRCDAGYEKKFDFGRKMYYCECAVGGAAREAPTSPTKPPVDVTTPAGEITTPAGEICPHGNRYSPEGFDKCVAGYHEVWEGWFPSRRRYCDCDKAPPGEEGNGDGFFGDIFGEGEGAGKIGNVALLVVGGAVVVALLGLFKK